MRDFRLDKITMGWSASAFNWTYALFQIPGGWLADRFGSRLVLAGAITWWSIFTAATALVPRLSLASWFGVAWAFAIVRFLIGLGEGTAFPNANKIVAFWNSSDSRGIANSIFFAGIGVGGALTPASITWIMVKWGWRASFYASAVLGLVVALIWWLYATDRPEEHRHVNCLELAMINPRGSGTLSRTEIMQRRPPWGKIFRSVSVLSLVLSYLCIGYPAYIYYTWFFIYLVRVRGFSLAHSALWGSTPFVAIVLLAPFGGWVSDRAVACWGKSWGRRHAVWLGVILSATLLSAGAQVIHKEWAVVLLACAAGFNLFAVPSWWATCNDLTPNFCGSLSGLMNMFGNIGGWLSPIVTAHIATRYGWSLALDFAALLTLAAGLFWVVINANEHLEGDQMLNS